MYSDVEITSHCSDLLEHSRKFNLDVSGPRVLFCADAAVNLMLKSGASQYLEFKGIDASFVCDADGQFSTVPDSRAAIFKDRTLSLTEKNQLMRFFKLVQGHLAASDEAENDANGRISEEDLESPFVEFLNKMRLPPKIKSYRSHRPFLSVSESSLACSSFLYLQIVAFLLIFQEIRRICLSFYFYFLCLTFFSLI